MKKREQSTISRLQTLVHSFPTPNTLTLVDHNLLYATKTQCVIDLAQALGLSYSFLYGLDAFFLFLGSKNAFHKIQGENVILVSNHQTEADPAVIALLLEATNPHIAENVVRIISFILTVMTNFCALGIGA